MTSRIITEKRLFQLFVWLALVFYGISAFFGGGTLFKNNAPPWLLVSRDVVYLSLLVFYSVKLGPEFREKIWPQYRSWYIGFFSLLLGYSIIVAFHSLHRSSVGILQHELRNIIGYSGFLFFTPLLLPFREDWGRLLKTFLIVGVFQAAYAITSRYSGFPFMTWSGRLTGTMADPNNFSVFMALCLFIIFSKWEEYPPPVRWGASITFLTAFTLASSVTGLGVFLSGIGLIWLFKNRTLQKLLFYLLVFYLIILIPLGVKILENRELSVKFTIHNFISGDLYLNDKLDNVTGGLFSRFFLFGLEVDPDSPLRTITNRRSQFDTLRMTMPGPLSPTFWVGDIFSTEYRKFDNQYINLFWNSGFISILIVLAIFSPAFYLGLKNWFRFKDDISLLLWIFLVSLFVVGFNGSAFLNRFPLNFVSYLFLGAIVILSKPPCLTVDK